jgi:hypothetical protein
MIFTTFNFQEAESTCKFLNFTSAESIFASVSLSGVSPSDVLTTVSQETLTKTHLPAKSNAIEKAFHLIETKLVDRQGDIPQLRKQNNANPMKIENSTSAIRTSRLVAIVSDIQGRIEQHQFSSPGGENFRRPLRMFEKQA